MPDPTQIARLEADGLVRFEGDQLHTTRRWQAAMARAALVLRDSDDPSDDLRVPIALALLGLYGETLDEIVVADLVAVMLPIELAEAGVR